MNASIGFRTSEFIVQLLRERDIAELQAFTEANPEYWILTYGHRPHSDDVRQSLERHPPADVSYSEHFRFVVRAMDTQDVVAQIDVATNLLAAGVYHLGFFMTATRLHGTGFAQRLHQAYERWAVDRGARW